MERNKGERGAKDCKRRRGRRGNLEDEGAATEGASREGRRRRKHEKSGKDERMPREPRDVPEESGAVNAPRAKVHA